MTQVETPPTADDWRQAIVAFTRNRALDRTEFRQRAAQLVPALIRASDSAYDTAARAERGESADITSHDGAEITRLLEGKGYADQIGLAALDLLRLKPIQAWLDHRDPYGVMPMQPTSVFVFGKMDAEARVEFEKPIAISQRWGLDAFARPVPQRPIVLLRLQAERLLDGARRVQRTIDDYETRRDAIKPAASVALHELFEITEAWDVDAAEIARQLVAAGVLPDREISYRDPVEQWHQSLRRRRQAWRKRRARLRRQLARRLAKAAKT